jgi:hypothetical protein|tara:strand:+ start:8850 stop:9374 length:525 start_codon:yes stop_codon:yes gene_type:complete
MAYRGISNPMIRVMSTDGQDEIQAIDLPNIVRDGRNEEWENLTESYENIDGEIITGSPKFRFKAEYQFGMIHGYDSATDAQRDKTDVDGGFIDKMSQFYNNRTQFNLVPHSDTKFINYDVIIEELDLHPFEGLSKYASAKVTFLGVKYTKAIPTIDNMLGCVFYNRIFGIDDVN